MNNLALVGPASAIIGQSNALVGTITFICPSCREYAHKWRSRVRSHLMSCDRPRLCICPRCEKPLVSRGQLKRHLREDCPISIPSDVPEPLPTALPLELYDGPDLVIDEQVVSADSNSLPDSPITPGRLDCASVVGLGGVLFCCTLCGSTFGQYLSVISHQRSCLRL